MKRGEDTRIEKHGQSVMAEVQAKKVGRSKREMPTPLFLLRSVEPGISISDFDLLNIGLIIDMWTEKANDGTKYEKVAREAMQEDNESNSRKSKTSWTKSDVAIMPRL